MQPEKRLELLEREIARIREEMRAPPVRKFTDFSEALRLLKEGCKLTRQGWNGKGMWIHVQRPDAGSKMSLPYVYVRTADGQLVPWLASQADLLADDWLVSEEAPKVGVVRRRPDGSWDVEALERDFNERWRAKFGHDAPLQAVVEFSMGMRADCERQPPEVVERSFEWQ